MVASACRTWKPRGWRAGRLRWLVLLVGLWGCDGDDSGEVEADAAPAPLDSTPAAADVSVEPVADVDTPVVRDADTETIVDGQSSPQIDAGVFDAQPTADAQPAPVSDAAVGDALAEYYYPPVDPADDTWETVAPAELGWNGAALEALADYAGEQNSTALIVLHRGRMVLERYWGDWDLHTADRIYSAAKSVTALLVGRAQREGHLQIDDPVRRHLGPGWSRARRAAEAEITVRHLLTMTSGLDDDLALSAEAGTAWYYNNTAYHQLFPVLEAVTGESMNDVVDRWLGSPIGMRDSRWLNVTLRASARDMARFGLLILSQGRWAGEEVLGDADYITDMLTTSQALNPAYGYLWWLNGQARFRLPGDPPPAGEGPLIPNAPMDLVAALGLEDKKVYVAPSLDLVVCRHGGAANEDQFALSSFDNMLWTLLSAALP